MGYVAFFINLKYTCKPIFMKLFFNYLLKCIVIVLSMVLFSNCIGKYTVENEQEVTFDSNASSKMVSTNGWNISNIYILSPGGDTCSRKSTYEKGEIKVLERGWIRVEDSSKKDDDLHSLTISVESNTTGAERKGQIDLVMMDAIERIMVIQKK